ncbi:MAG: methylmalonyl-CoA mutase family protein, partial [Acidobacteriota bacterium]
LTRVDPWVNMLRAGAQTFVGACAQADIIFAPRFDQLLGEGDEMGRRSAINAQHVLAQEAHLGRVADPAGGSWALEKMTDRLARRAWELFREIEALGGFAQCLRSGEVARRIAEKAERRRADLRGRRQAIVGVSAFPLLGEKRPSFHDAATLEAAGTTETAGPAGTAGPAEEGSALEATEPTVDAVSQALARGAALAALEAELTQRAGGEADVSCPPLEARRDAEEFESVRLTVDARVASGEERPRVLLIALGDRRDFKARLDFAAEFVSVAGFEAETLESIGSLEALDRLHSAWRESSPAAGILCSSDERYGTLAAPAAEALKAAGAERILLAGRPGPLEEAWRRAGIEGFIFLGCDLLEALRPTLEAVLAPPTSTPSSRTVDGGSER